MNLRNRLLILILLIAILFFSTGSSWMDFPSRLFVAVTKQSYANLFTIISRCMRPFSLRNIRQSRITGSVYFRYSISIIPIILILHIITFSSHIRHLSLFLLHKKQVLLKISFISCSFCLSLINLVIAL